MSKAPIKTSGSIKGSVKVAPSSAREKLSPSEIEELQAVFDLFDEDHGGTIDPSEIQKILSELGLDRRNPTVFTMIQDLQEKQKPINFDEFLNIICNRVGDVKSKEGLQKVFNLYDVDGTGSIDFEKLKNIAKELGENLNDD
jgi:Ca2+-binding EF-hand superfamily protein